MRAARALNLVAGKFFPAPFAALPGPVPARLFAGTSGWAYATWKPGFYPEGLAQKKFLEFYASQLTSVEVNYTFRALPTAKMLEGWLGAVGADFCFSFKAPQRITHFKRLVDCEALVEQFVAALKPVEEQGRLGVLLFQLPPNFKADAGRLAGFLQMEALRARGVRIAFEFRHDSWFTEEIYALLREHNAALCVAEGDDLQTPEVHTAEHICLRLRRGGGYSAAEIEAFAGRLTVLAREHDVFVYFRHEDEPTGALNAVALLRKAAALAAGGKD